MYNINEGVVEKLRRRAERGHSKYGVTMDRTDLTELEWLQHAQEELMDGAVYLEKLIRLNGTCDWRYAGPLNSHQADCGHSIDRQIDMTDFTFCPFCGRRIAFK